MTPNLQRDPNFDVNILIINIHLFLFSNFLFPTKCMAQGFTCTYMAEQLEVPPLGLYCTYIYIHVTCIYMLRVYTCYKYVMS